MVSVVRDEAEVFDERSIASFEGAPVTLRHPAGRVDPTNWNDLAVGHVQNVRRQGEVLVADFPARWPARDRCRSRQRLARCFMRLQRGLRADAGADCARPTSSEIMSRCCRRIRNRATAIAA